MNANRVRVSAGVWALVFLSGCATIITGTSQGVTVDSDPRGATCSIARGDEQLAAISATPAQVTLSKGWSDLTVDCKKEGHISSKTVVPSSFQPWTLANILNGAVGVVVDAASGAITEYPKAIGLLLVPSEFAAAEERDTHFEKKKAARPVSNWTGVVTSSDGLPRPQFSESSVFLEIPHLRQEKNLCVPTSTAMVLEYFGESHAPRELKVLSRGRDYDPKEPFSDFTITFFSDLVLGLRKIGYDWRESKYTNNGWGFRRGLKDIRENLRRGNPVLVDTTLFGGHTFVVTGFDDDNAVLYFADPNIGAPGLRTISYEQFETIWSSEKTGFYGRGAILTTRR
ncbi:MAG TPA: C39 family peptidase [Burkholderiales bacterium]